MTDQYGLAAYGLTDGYRGNIDLNNRPVLIDGPNYKTEESISFEPTKDRSFTVTIPTVLNGQKVSDKDAIEHYYKTNQYLDAVGRNEFGPISDNAFYKKVDDRATSIHNRQGHEYEGLAKLLMAK